MTSPASPSPPPPIAIRRRPTAAAVTPAPVSSLAPGRTHRASLTALGSTRKRRRSYLTNEFGLWYFFTMPMNKAKPALLAGALLALALAAGASAASREHQPLPRRLLDAEDGDGEDHPGLAEDAATATASRSASRTAPRPTRRAPSRTASRPTSSSSRPATTSTCSSTPASSTRSGTARATTASPPTRVVVFAVRNGNPKHIKGWADLIKPGVQVVTPNPFSSGSAKWNILAAYGAQRRLGKTDKQATAYVQKLFKHVVSQDTSGRNATNTFLVRQGRRPHHLRERGDQLAPERPGHPVRDPAPVDADRAADRGH